MKFWDRILFTGLAIVDGLFDSNLVERELERRRRRLQVYQKKIDDVQQKIDDLHAQLMGLHLQLCLTYLRQRYMADPNNWLRFETGSKDERGLELLIEYLVKPRLATIETHEIAPRHHVYHLQPDWSAIATAIGETPEVLEVEAFVWLQQQIAEQVQSQA